MNNILMFRVLNNGTNLRDVTFIHPLTSFYFLPFYFMPGLMRHHHFQPSVKNGAFRTLNNMTLFGNEMSD